MFPFDKINKSFLVHDNMNNVRIHILALTEHKTGFSCDYDFGSGNISGQYFELELSSGAAFRGINNPKLIGHFQNHDSGTLITVDSQNSSLLIVSVLLIVSIGCFAAIHALINLDIQQFSIASLSSIGLIIFLKWISKIGQKTVIERFRGFLHQIYKKNATGV